MISVTSCILDLTRTSTDRSSIQEEKELELSCAVNFSYTVPSMSKEEAHEVLKRLFKCARIAYAYF